MQKGIITKKHGGWYVRYREPAINGKRAEVWKYLAAVDTRYKAARDVGALARKVMNSINSLEGSPGGTQRLQDFIELVYFPNIQKSPSTIHGYKHIFTKHLKGRLGDIRVFDFTTGVGQKLLRTIAAETDLSKTSLKHIKHFLTGVFTFARQESVIDSENPMRDVAIPDGAASEDTYAYSLEEIQVMLEVLPEPAKIVVATAAFTGLRRSELRGLKWDDVTETELNIRRSVWNTHIRERTKTTSSRAPIPLVPILQKWLVQHRGNFQAEGFIFVGGRMQPLNLANLARRVIVPKLVEHNVQWYGWHAFRRGLGTNLYRIGTPDKTIQAILRHSNVSTTLNFYVKPVSVDSQTAMRKLENAFEIARQSARQANQEIATNLS